MKMKYRLGIMWQFIVWIKPVDENMPWRQTGLWCASMPEALERVIGSPYARWQDCLRQVAPWYWVVMADSINDVFTQYIIVRRSDCPDPDDMPLDPIEEPKPVDPSFKRLPTLL